MSRKRKSCKPKARVGFGVRHTPQAVVAMREKGIADIGYIDPDVLVRSRHSK